MAFLGAVTLASASARSPLGSSDAELSPAQRLALLDQDPPEDDGVCRAACMVCLATRQRIAACLTTHGFRLQTMPLPARPARQSSTSRSCTRRWCTPSAVSRCL